MVSPGSCATTSTKVSCSSITDDFCNELYDKNHKGKIDVPVGKFFFGQTDKSNLSMAKRMDIEALIAAKERLPADLREEGTLIINEFESHLKNEEDTKKWYRTLTDIELRFSNLVNDVAEERTYKRRPELMKNKKNQLSQEDSIDFNEDSQNIRNEILEAKYKQDPNWKRVEQLFEQAQKDVKSEILKLNIPKELMQKISDKVSSVQLSLPYSDPRLLPIFDGCDSTVNNAFYTPSYNKLTLCVGRFNSIQSSASLYSTLVHELTHSIDSSNQPLDEMMDADLGKVLKTLCHSKVPAYSCDDWRTIRSKVLISLKEISEPNPIFRKLTSCLKSEAKLKPFDNKTLKNVAEEEAGITINSWATANAFTYLAQPTLLDNNGTENFNNYYMQPELLRTSYRGNFRTTDACYDDVVAEIFVQELECQGYSKALSTERPKLFNKAISETKALKQIINEHWYSYCGRECSSLVAKGLSRSTSEEVAEWMKYRLLSGFVAREPDLALRRQIVAGSVAAYCEAPGVLNSAAALTIEEKKYSYEEHPDNRVRRLAAFTPQIVQLLDCDPGNEIRLSKECDL